MKAIFKCYPMKDILRIVRNLKIIFAVLVALPLIYIGLTEYGAISISLSIPDELVKYNYEMASILLTLIVVPSSLKLFSTFFKKRVEEEVSFVKALKRYYILSIARLSALFIVAMFNIVLYYSVENSNIGILCFFICIIAYMFCIPGKERVKSDLHLENIQ